MKLLLEMIRIVKLRNIIYVRK